MQTFYMGHWIPEYAAQFLIVLTGFALMFQAYRIAGILFLLAMGSIFMPVILQILQPLAWEAAQQAPTAITSEITRGIGAPEWAQGIVGALVSIVAVYMVFVIVVLGIVRWIFGRDTFSHVMSSLLVEPVRFLLASPFLLIAWLFRRVARRR